MSSQLLRLNAFRGEPASSGFEWHFTPNHNSSADSSTSVGSDLHLVSPKLHPGTLSEPWALPTAWSLRFHVLFHSPTGVLFTLPSQYYFAIGHPGAFSLARWSLLIHTGFHVSHATLVRALRPFHSLLLRESLLLSFPPAIKMFQFARLSLIFPWIQQQFERLTYSRISGSMLIFNSPKHFIAYYAQTIIRNLSYSLAMHLYPIKAFTSISFLRGESLTKAFEGITPVLARRRLGCKRELFDIVSES
ncbi:hypothetical protein PVK06_047575 [Gossypium arboreum]|uniref:Uncharacterized protein n=1 Tax=Gossypium arboreum TaxID=29729 RepID=A0ABR0MDR8_GOSAR|nr:hypothetical protein PVK06_047575 [Gossypium arboreum]